MKPITLEWVAKRGRGLVDAAQREYRGARQRARIYDAGRAFHAQQYALRNISKRGGKYEEAAIAFGRTHNLKISLLGARTQRGGNQTDIDDFDNHI